MKKWPRRLRRFLVGTLVVYVAFFVVYNGEAHPSDAWQLPSNVRVTVVYASPANAEERSDLADICVTKLGIKLPAIVDRFDDATDKAYSGWPDRLYLIDKQGRIAYRSNPGPFGFKPDELEAPLKPHVPAPAKTNYRSLQVTWCQMGGDPGSPHVPPSITPREHRRRCADVLECASGYSCSCGTG